MIDKRVCTIPETALPEFQARYAEWWRTYVLEDPALFLRMRAVAGRGARLVARHQEDEQERQQAKCRNDYALFQRMRPPAAASKFSRAEPI